VDVTDIIQTASLPEVIDKAAAYLMHHGWGTLLEFVRPGSRLYVWALVGALALAAISFRLYHSEGEGESEGEGKGKRGTIRRFLAYCFPRAVWTHPSAVLDYKLFVMNRLLGPLIPFSTIGLTAALSYWLAKFLNTHLGVFPHSLPWNAWSIGAVSIVYIVVGDFLEFVLHWAQHRIPVLWRLHRVHHSAETLTPITLFRVHPFLDVFFNKPMRAGMLGVLGGVLFYLFFQGNGRPVVLVPLVTFQMLFNVLGSNLRHSHIWLSYGWVASHVFVSPAMHQIHHSIAPEHLYKNLGVSFSVWDWLFGTLYIPRQREQLTFGLEAGASQAHPSLWKVYTEPFI